MLVYLDVFWVKVRSEFKVTGGFSAVFADDSLKSENEVGKPVVKPCPKNRPELETVIK